MKYLLLVASIFGLDEGIKQRAVGKRKKSSKASGCN